jgi:hypothetical protein
VEIVAVSRAVKAERKKLLRKLTHSFEDEI